MRTEYQKLKTIAFYGVYQGLNTHDVELLVQGAWLLLLAETKDSVGLEVAVNQVYKELSP